MQTEANTDIRAAVQAAENLWRRNQYVAALDAYMGIIQTRLALRLADSLGADDLVVIERLADLAALAGHTSGADKLLDGMASLCREKGNTYAADYTALKRVHLALSAGMLRDAYAQLQVLSGSIGDIKAIAYTAQGLLAWEAARHWEGADSDSRSVLLTRIYLTLGWSLAAVGQYRSALVTLRRGLEQAEAATHDLVRQAVIPLQLATASALIEYGDLAAAERELKACQHACQQSTHPAHATRWLELDGQIALLRGEYSRSKERLHAARAQCAAHTLAHATLRAELNEAQMLLSLNQTVEATSLLAAAEHQARREGDHSAAVRISLLKQVALARSQSLVDGVPIAPSVRAMWFQSKPTSQAPALAPSNDAHELTQSAGYLTFFDDRALGFQWQLAYHSLADARTYLQYVSSIFDGTDSALIQIRLNVLTGMLAYYEGQPSVAERLFAEAIPHLQAHGLRPELWQAQRFLAWCWAALGRSHNDRLALATANDYLLNSLAATLDGAERAMFLLNKWTDEEEAFAVRSNELATRKVRMEGGSPLLRPMRWLRLQKGLLALVRDIDRYKNLRARAQLSGGERPLPRTTSGWRKLVRQADHRATVSFLVLPDRILIICAYGLRRTFGISALTRIQLRNLIRSWHESVQRAGWRQPGRHLGTLDTFEQTSKDLDLITADLAEKLQVEGLLASLPAHIQALTIVPDDSLHGFPFAAIKIGDQRLIDRYRLTIAPEHSDVRERNTKLRRRALLAGVSRGTGRFAPLRGVTGELDAVEAWTLRNRIETERVEDNGASRARVLAALPQATLAHIACHGIFQLDRPDCSGLVFIPEEHQSEIVSLRDVSDLDLSGLEHITLAACWSADNFILPGRHVVSLPETLWRSGAGSVLGSLWPVRDAFSGAFMTQFYAYLERHPRDEALRLTQLDCVHNRLPGYTTESTVDPSFWAGFTLYGRYEQLFKK